MGRVTALLLSSALLVALTLVLVRDGCGGENLPREGAAADGRAIVTPPPVPPRTRSSRAPEPVPPSQDPPSGDPGAPPPGPPGEAAQPSDPGELPADELGTGDCILRLRLVDADNGGPLESAVRIWRREVAPSARFTAGDQVQRRIDVPTTGAVVVGLPPGRYRVEVEAARGTSDDPPEFTLSGESEEVVRVPMPRSFPLRCVVVDRNGAPLISALHRTGTTTWESVRPRPAPAWSAPRRTVSTDPAASSGPGTTGGVWSTEAQPEQIVAGPGGFELGATAESSRVAVFRKSHLLEVDGSSTVRVWAGSQAAGRGDYIAVAVSLDALVAHLRLADGRPVGEAGATITATSTAVERTPESPPDLWRTIPISVAVSVEGYAPLRFEWRASDPPRDTVTLARAPEPDGK